VPGTASPAGVTKPNEDHGVAIHSFDVSQSALDVFEPEPTRAGSPDAPAVSGGEPRISLAELKAGGILFDQNDAVAIGQALCRAFMGSQLRRRMNPRVSDLDTSGRMTTESVLIDSAGRVKTSVGDLDDETAAVNNIGRILSDLLPGDGRSFLKSKVISKALSSPPLFQTVDELSQALRALERPDGREVIRAIFQLWRRSSQPVVSPAFAEEPRPPVVKPATPLASAPDVPAEERQAKPQAPSRGRQIILVAAIVGGGVFSFLIGVFILISWLGTGPTAPSAAVARATADAQAPSEVQAAAVDRNGVAFTGPLPPRQPRVLRSTPATAGRPVPVAAPSRPVPVAASAAMIGTASDVSWRPLDVQENRAHPPNPRGANRGFATIDDPAGTSADLPPVYTVKDADVVPPTPILPRLLAGLRPSTPGIRPDALTVAVVVAPDGSVESVRGLVTPQSMGETVLLTEALSAVKSWRFSPATKDGEPVKYEQVVPVRR